MHDAKPLERSYRGLHVLQAAQRPDGAARKPSTEYVVPARHPSTGRHLRRRRLPGRSDATLLLVIDLFGRSGFDAEILPDRQKRAGGGATSHSTLRATRESRRMQNSPPPLS